MKAVALRATKRPKRAQLANEGTITTPNLSLSIQKIIERSQMGMEVQGQQAIYLGPQHDEFANFDQLDKMEQIDKVRDYSKKADKELQETKKQIAQAQKDAKEHHQKQYKEQVRAQVLQELKEQKL